MRHHAQAEGSAGRIPDAVIVGRQHPEAVAARRQVGVKRSPPAARVDPALVEALQLIAVLNFLRGHKAQAGILELEPVGARPDRELLIQTAKRGRRPDTFRSPPVAARGSPACARDR